MSFNELVHPKVLAPASGDIVLPPGFGGGPSTGSTKSKKAEPVKKPSETEMDQLKVKKAWEMATSPAKSIPMNLIMSYMTGNSLQMIPIMMTLMLLWNPIRAIFTETGAAFQDLTNDRIANELLLPKVVFILCHLANTGIGVWKLNKMGLVPNSEADWLAWKDAAKVVERLVYSGN
ncbi:CIC11C00000003004 [Sungouiella intermedia]|uniref:ER membrane protein complex subunit 4 n=1 Tax=Sungouiella intermedia TaxID=45354 RepID=A0A1L0DR07_9ASCO|nr:CIC11C00000003004 [[Candida] intermedia]